MKFELWIKTYEDKEFRLHMIGDYQETDESLNFLRRKYKCLSYHHRLIDEGGERYEFLEA